VASGEGLLEEWPTDTAGCREDRELHLLLSALSLVPEVGVLGCPFGEGARGLAENLFRLTGDERRLPDGLGLQGQEAAANASGTPRSTMPCLATSGGISR